MNMEINMHAFFTKNNYLLIQSLGITNTSSEYLYIYIYSSKRDNLIQISIF
jgi:hypothetical protein